MTSIPLSYPDFSRRFTSLKSTKFYPLFNLSFSSLSSLFFFLFLFTSHRVKEGGLAFLVSYSLLEYRIIFFLCTFSVFVYSSLLDLPISCVSCFSIFLFLVFLALFTHLVLSAARPGSHFLLL